MAWQIENSYEPILFHHKRGTLDNTLHPILKKRALVVAPHSLKLKSNADLCLVVRGQEE
jgi:hypothetical protein